MTQNASEYMALILGGLIGLVILLAGIVCAALLVSYAWKAGN